jgi:LacI family transcriptional regulator
MIELANAMPPDIPRVALLIETSRGYGRAMLRGVVRYGRLHGPWRFYLTPGDFEQALPQMSQWGATGIIARIETPKIARAILASRLPTIALDISQNIPLSLPQMTRFSEIASDSVAAARLAAQHLVERGFRNFAFVGEPSRLWSQNREKGFRARLAEAGFEPIIYKCTRVSRSEFWERDQALLAKWIVTLPKPIGLMACNDDRGRQVLDACRAAGVVVPLEVAVIGVDNDELLCELADPPLSSVALNAEAGGYRAAALLDEMMRGKSKKRQRLIVEPTYVVERRSTEASAVVDEDVAAALQLIHNHAIEQFGIEDIVERLQISRRALELKFKDAIGRTPYDELQRVRLLRAQRILLETDFPIPKVAAMSGYGSGAYLAQVFQKQIGKTPAQFRRSHRT